MERKAEMINDIDSNSSNNSNDNNDNRNNDNRRRPRSWKWMQLKGKERRTIQSNVEWGKSVKKYKKNKSNKKEFEANQERGETVEIKKKAAVEESSLENGDEKIV